MNNMFLSASRSKPDASGPSRTDGSACGQQANFLSEVSLPVGAALVLAPFTLQRHQRRFEETFWLVRGVSLERRYEHWEAQRQRLDAAVFALIWLCSVGAAVLNHTLIEASGRPPRIALRVCLTAIFSGVILCLAHGVAHFGKCRDVSQGHL